MKTLIGIIGIIVLGSCGINKGVVADRRQIIAVDTLFGENANFPGTFITYYDSVKVDVIIYAKRGNFKTEYKIVNK